MDVGGTQQSFDICYAVEGIGEGFNLGWTLLPGNTALLMGMNSSALGYVSFGFPPNPEPDTGEPRGLCCGRIKGWRPCCRVGSERACWQRSAIWQYLPRKLTVTAGAGQQCCLYRLPRILTMRMNVKEDS